MEVLKAPIHRRSNSHITYYLNNEANNLSEIIVRETFEHWGDATNFKFEYRGRHYAGLRQDGINTISFLVKWPERIPMNKVAYCQNWYNQNGEIIESDIIFNMMIAKFTTLRTNKPDSYYIEGVLSHEIGHMLGLEHIDSEESLMKQFSPIEESYFFGRIDYATLEQLRELYK